MPKLDTSISAELESAKETAAQIAELFKDEPRELAIMTLRLAAVLIEEMPSPDGDGTQIGAIPPPQPPC